MSPTPPVSIIGFAGCTALGYSVPTTLAAMGAGLSNFTDTGLKSSYGTRITAASLLERDIPRIERLVTLASLGLVELHRLLARAGVPQAPLILGLPSTLDRDEAVALETELRSSVAVHPDATWYPYGRVSTFAALAHAAESIGRGAHRFVVVGGIDSLCAVPTVSALVHAERILGPHTEGTIPGEAAVFALLARSDDPAVDPSCSVVLEGVAQERGEPHRTVDRVSADHLAAVFRSFIARGSPRVNRVIAAHSGEGYFGRSFAHAYLRALELMPEPLETELIADRVGDIGAAAGVLGLALGVYRMATEPRNSPDRTLVYSESDTGEVGAAIISGAPAAWAADAA